MPSQPIVTWVTVCRTCQRGDRPSSAHPTDGERLSALVAEAAERTTGGVVAVREFACLMGCSRACNVAIQAPGKLAYTLGDFAPEADAAAGIVDWARRHAASDGGIVPYRDWPQAVKGHFVTRHPPPPADVPDAAE